MAEAVGWLLGGRAPYVKVGGGGWTSAVMQWGGEGNGVPCPEERAGKTKQGTQSSRLQLIDLENWQGS